MNLTLDEATPLPPDHLAAAWTIALHPVSWVLAAAIALAAAWLGAWMMQRSVESDRLRVELARELRDTNAAIAWAHAILNVAAALKKQHIVGIRQQFESNRARLEDQIRRRASGEIQGNVWPHFDISLRSLVPPTLATARLRDLVLERISVPGRPLTLAIRLHDVATLLVEAIHSRNEQVDEFRKAGGLEALGQAQRYFGLPFGTGHVDETYRGTLEMMASSADDAIHFSYLLCVDLDRHAASLLSRYRQRLGSRDAPRKISIDFAAALADGTIPEHAQRPDLVPGFVEAGG